MTTQVNFEILKNAMFLCELCKNDILAYTTAIDNYAFIADLYAAEYGKELMDEAYTLIKRMFL